MSKPDEGENGDLVVNVHEAKTHFSRLLRRGESGQVVVIAKASKPIARQRQATRSRFTRMGR